MIYNIEQGNKGCLSVLNIKTSSLSSILTAVLENKVRKHDIVIEELAQKITSFLRVRLFYFEHLAE